MTELVVVALAGFCASLVDGALGMGFGPTSATLLLGTGLSPAATSATVNLAKVATGLAAGVSHWRFSNVDRALVVRLGASGAAGAVVGTTLLATVDGEAVRPLLAVLLAVVGLRILVRFSRPLPAPAAPAARSPAALAPPDRGPQPADPGPSPGPGPGPRLPPVRGAAVAGAAGGVTNGLVGAWGPVVTPFLLQRGVPARYAVGSVNTAEVAVAVVASGSLLTSLGGRGIAAGVVVAMLLGGVAAAPLAAWVVRFLPPRPLGLAVAGLLLVTQARELAGAGLLPGGRWPAYGLVVGAVAVAALRGRRPARLAA